MEKERGFNFSRISKKKIFNIIFFILFIMLDFKIIMNINMESINLKQAFIILFENVLALVVLLRNENADKKNTFIIRIALHVMPDKSTFRTNFYIPRLKSAPF